MTDDLPRGGHSPRPLFAAKWAPRRALPPLATLLACLLGSVGTVHAQANAPARAQPNAPAPARAQGNARPAPSKPRSPRGDFVYDIREFGARPNDSTVDAKGRTSVDRAWDAIFGEMPPEKGTHTQPCTIYFPSGTWIHNDPLLADRDFLTIKGEGRDTTRIAPVFSRACSTFQLGFRRAPTNPNAGKDPKGVARKNPSNGKAWEDPAVLGREHWVDLHGKLDETMAGSPGKRWGFRTHGDSHLTFGSSPWNCGKYDYYGATDQLTFDLCLDGRGSAIQATDTSVIGMADPMYGPNPFCVIPSEANEFRVQFRTADQAGPAPGWRQFSYRVPASQSGVQRHAIQIDLKEAKVSAFVNGVQLATSGVVVVGKGPSKPWSSASHLTFRPNGYQPFNVGSYAVDQFNSYNEGAQGTIPDLSLLGMKLSKGLRYRVKEPGDKQVAAGGGPVHDRYRYDAEGDASMIACLTLDDPPNGSDRCRYDGRMVHWTSNGTRGNGWFMSTNTQGGNNGWVVNPVVRDLTIVGQQPWGEGISIGGIIGLAQIQDVSVQGGFFRSLGGLSMGSSYPIEVTGCRLDGAFDAAYYGDTQIINKLDFTANTMGTTGLRLRGSELKSSNMYFGGQQTFNGIRPPGGAIEHLVRLHAGQYAGTYTLTFSYDGEDPAVPTKAQVEVDNHHVLTTVVLRDCKFGCQSPSAPAAVILHDQNDATANLKAPLRFLAEGCTITLSGGGEPKAFVMTDGPLARGNLRDCQLIDPAKTQHIKHAGPGGVGNIRWTYDLGDFPEKGPAAGTWEAGAFAQPNPDGTTTYCTASGTFGGPKPPKFEKK